MTAEASTRGKAKFTLRVSAGLLAQCRLVAEQDRRSLNSWLEGLMVSAVSAWTMGSAVVVLPEGLEKPSHAP